MMWTECDGNILTEKGETLRTGVKYQREMRLTK